MTKRKFYALIVLLILLGTVFSRGFDFTLPEPPADVTDATGLTVELLDEDGWYYGAHDVAMYLDTYGHLPGNYMTKDEARELGWEGGSLKDYAPGKAIGGDRFGNYEGLLPRDGDYTECDVNYFGGYRGGERLVYDTDGNIWYTADHYETFEPLYPQ